MEHHQHGQHAGSHHVHFDSPDMVAFAQEEGEALSGLADQAISRLGRLCGRHGVAVRRVLDIGSGPGLGTCRLAGEFDDATVVAVDGSAPMLERVQPNAERFGVAPRVEVRLAELPTGLGSLGPADVVWASLSLHHVGDEVGALRGIRRLLEPAGLLAVVEPAGPLRFGIPDGVAVPAGLWDRLDAAWETWFAGMRAQLPDATPSGAHAEMLAAAGFEVLVAEVLTLSLPAPLDEGARRFARRQLLHARDRLGPQLATAELQALDVLVDESAKAGILHRDDVSLTARRHLYVARPVADTAPVQHG